MGNSEIGMTDKQYKGFIRFLLEALKDAMNEPERANLDAKLEKIAENLQATLED